MDTIDITDLKDHGQDLTMAIENAVRDTQSVIIRTLPNKLVVRKDQYDELQPDPELRGVYKSNEYIWVTSQNAMDIIIK